MDSEVVLTKGVFVYEAMPEGKGQVRALDCISYTLNPSDAYGNSGQYLVFCSAKGASLG